MSNNPQKYKDYLVPQSVVSLVHIQGIRDVVDDLDAIPLVDEAMVAN